MFTKSVFRLKEVQTIVSSLLCLLTTHEPRGHVPPFPFDQRTVDLKYRYFLNTCS